MIRSGSKLLKKGGSVRNIGKVGSKFRFVVDFETCTRILANSDVVVTWERKGVVLSTDPVKVDRGTRSVNFSGQKLTQIVTMFKKKKAGMEFDEKAYLICVRVGNDKGKIIGKIFLNFAEYVSMPEFSKRMVAKLSHDGELVMRITSTYVGEAKKRKSSAGSSSVSSSTIGASVNDEPSEPDNDQSDLTDLDLPDFEDSESALTKASSRSERNSGLVPSSSRKERERERERSKRDPSRNGSATVAPSPSRRRKEAARVSGLNPTVNAMEDSISNRTRTTTGTGMYSDNGASTRGGATVARTEFEKVKRENRAYVRKINDLEAQNEELEEKLASAGLNSSAGKLEALEDENERLQKEVRDLKNRLSREPVYADVVRELKDAKMALAILSTENAELKSRRR